MPVAAAIAVIAGAVISVAGSVYSANVTSEDTKRAQDIAQKMEEQARQDDLAYKASQEKLSKAQLGLNKKQFAWQQTEATKDRAERSGVRASEQRQGSYNNILNLLNSRETMRNNLFNLSQRGQQNVIGGKV